MSFFDLISSRHSIRAFKDKKLSSETVDKILNAATKAPSAGNLQSYQIFIVTKKTDKQNIAVAAHEQNFIENASVVFAFCADPQNSSQTYGERGSELYCIQDATIVCAYAQLAAHVLGLDSVWVGSFDEKAIQNILKCKSNIRPVAMLVVGFADEEPEITPRKPLADIIHTL